MLATCGQGLATASHLDTRATSCSASFPGSSPSTPAVAVDGCGPPVFAASLEGLTRATPAVAELGRRAS
jgi:hypothetical protein